MRFNYARPLVCGAAALMLVALPAKLDASVLTPDQLPTINVFSDTGPESGWSYTPKLDDVTPNPAGRGYVVAPAGPFTILDGEATFKLSGMEFDYNPFVLNNISLINNTASTVNVTIQVFLPTTFAAPNLISGTIATSVISGTTGTATIATVGSDPIYSALIDSMVVATLQDAPFSLTTPPGGSAIAGDSFGPTGNAIAVTDHIGIQLRFSLTAGDTASILSRFDVIPEPGTAALAFAAGALFLHRRR